MGRPSSERRSAATARAPCSTVLGRWWHRADPGPRGADPSNSIRRGLDALVNALATADTGRTLGPGLSWAFRDRVDAGRRLAERLRHLRGEDAVVLGLPRGGVPVAAEVARALDAPLDVIVVRKLGVPFQPELAMGAVGEGGCGRGERARGARGARQRGRVRRGGAAGARGGRAAGAAVPRGPAAAGRWPAGRRVVVDDGIATGSTARAACRVARAQGAARVVLAVPVCARDAARALRAEVDEVVCLETPRTFFAVGQFYADFRPTSDDEVGRCCSRPPPVPAPARRGPAATADASTGRSTRRSR